MDSDKNTHDIEKLLRVLGKKIRIDILTKMNNKESLIPYSVLQKEVLELNQNSVNFSYHLKALENSNLIISSEEGYFITSLGKKILKIIISMEECIDHQNEVRLIRTSKYSKEIFDFKKIKEYLIEEGKLEKNLAEKIAIEVKKRLSKTHIKYLTAPLMREFINVILLENGLEEVRHRLTRLGTPPAEVFKLFDSVSTSTITPNGFIQKLGSEVSEQFLLLNLLPNELADLYLSGEVVLLNLNYWALRPQSVFIETETLFNYISKKYKITCTNSMNSRDFSKFLIHFLELISNIKSYISDDIVLGNFNKVFSVLFDDQKIEKRSNFLDILTTYIRNYPKNFEATKRYLCLDFSHRENGNKKDYIESRFQSDKYLIEKFQSNVYSDNYSKNPMIMFDYSELKPLKISNIVSNNGNIKNILNDIIFYNGKSSNLMNSTLVKVTDFNEYNINENKIILDKILINLQSVANHANQKDDLFFEVLQNKLNSVFQLFDYKTQLVHRKLHSINGWNQIITFLTEKKEEDWRNYLKKSISFFGLNEAVKIHCGIELDRLETSESFALKIISFLNHLIKEKNELDAESYVFTQPHPNIDLTISWANKNMNLNNSKNNASRMIRKDSKLSLIKQISLYKKFEEIIKGGSLFTASKDFPSESLEDYLKILMGSGLSAFAFD